jgi:5-oxoprolinase (ATP-hydrolysing)
MNDLQNTPNIWQVWAETGGTFTDCVAVDPDGTIHRAKVLSSSALRGTITEVLSGRRLRIRERWNAPADFIRGQRFVLLSDAGGGAGAAASPAIVVTSYDPDTQMIELAEAMNVASGRAFEVRSSCEAPVLAARLVTRTLPDQPLPPLALRVATTRGTNALLTRRGTPPAFFVTAGFADLLEIGTQQRPDLFVLDIVKPEPLTGEIVEVRSGCPPTARSCAR